MNNLEMSVSVIVGGMLIFLLMGYFIFYSNFYNSKTINEINTISTFSVEEIIDYDFSKIGYRAGTNSIINFDSTFIKFKADLDNNGIIDTVHYYFDNGLIRLVNPGNKVFSVPNVQNFEIAGFDSLKTKTNIISELKNIELQLTLNSKNLLNDTTFFATSYLEKIYIIKN